MMSSLQNSGSPYVDCLVQLQKARRPEHEEPVHAPDQLQFKQAVGEVQDRWVRLRRFEFERQQAAAHQPVQEARDARQGRLRAQVIDRGARRQDRNCARALHQERLPLLHLAQ